MKNTLLVAALTLGAAVSAEIAVAKPATAADFVANITVTEEHQLDELLVKLYGGNINKAEHAKKSLFNSLNDKSKIDSAISRSGSDCIDIFDPN